MTYAHYDAKGVSNSIRGMNGGGMQAPGNAVVNIMEYITMTNAANALDFGDLISACRPGGSCGSPTRGIWMGEYKIPAGVVGGSLMQYITISTTGNTATFGNLTSDRFRGDGASNAVRGLQMGGLTPTRVNTIDQITIATLGDAIDFGDLTVQRHLPGATASPTRAICVGGGNDNAVANIIDYVQIMTSGNAVDFGDLPQSRQEGSGACSNGHGGL